MTEDLKILAKGADTMLGDKGVNLSGGQKIRLSIARAMYSDRDIFLFDDPISALDIHVGKYVMEEGIVGYLKGKTRIVATHAIAYLPLFDYIYIMDEGEIVAEGDYHNLIETEAYKQLLESIKREEEKKRKNSTTDENEENPKKKKKEAAQAHQTATEGGLVSSSEAVSYIKDPADNEDLQALEDILQTEDRAEGSLSFQVSSQWIKLAGGAPRLILLVIMLTVYSCAVAGGPTFLQYWATAFSPLSITREEKVTKFLSIYISILFLQTVSDAVRVFSVFFGNLEMSKEVNFIMSFRLMHASVNNYFDRVPMGRLLNRFMKDVQVIDADLGMSTSFFVWSM